MADDRDDLQRGRSQPARQRGDGTAAKRQQRRAECQPCGGTDEAVKNSRSRHTGLWRSGSRIDVVSDEPGRRRRLRAGGALLRLRTRGRLAGARGFVPRGRGRERRKLSRTKVAVNGHDEPRVAPGFDFTPPAVVQPIKAVCGMRRNVLHGESSRRTRIGDARSKARFPAVLTSRSEPLRAVAIGSNACSGYDRAAIFDRRDAPMWHGVRARVPRSSRAEICCEP